MPFVFCSQNYSYPTVVRLKRAGDLNDVLLEFKVELPEVHWGKSVGNAKIGASFGVDMVNRMHLRISELTYYPLKAFSDNYLVFHHHLQNDI